MITKDENDPSYQKLEKLSKYFTKKLFLTYQGLTQNYAAVTEHHINVEQKELAWNAYDTELENRIMVPLLDIFTINQCGVAEMCTATLKLLELMGSFVEQVEQHQKEHDEVSFWINRFNG